MTPKESDYMESSFRERMLEHVFLSEFLQEVWRRGQTVDVLRSEVDNSGYDLVLEWGEVRRPIQLKSSRSDAKTSRQGVNAKLGDKPGGCVIWLSYADDAERVSLEYRFFGKGPGECPNLGDRVRKHTKANAQGEKAIRPNQRVLNRGEFTVVSDVCKLLETLFPGIPGRVRSTRPPNRPKDSAVANWGWVL